MFPDHAFSLALRRPRFGEVVVATACVGLLVVGAAVVGPYAGTPLDAAGPFLPAYTTAILAFDLIAATLLLSHYAALGAPAFLALAAAYLFNGLTAIGWTLSFPGVFSEAGQLGGDMQTTAIIAAFRRLAFPLGVLGYAALRRWGPQPASWRPRPRRRVAVVAASILAAGLATWIGAAPSGSAPTLMATARVPTEAWNAVLWVSIALTVAAAVAVARLRPFSVLDLWLLVTLAALLMEIAMLGFLAEGVRLSLGWWAGRLFGLASMAVVALVLLAETATLTARSVTTLMAEVQARRTRESTLEALGAAIAHELNQPLAAIVTSAEAAGRWLDRDDPDLPRARERLAAIGAEGARAGRVLDGLRRSFGRGPARGAPVDAGSLLASVAALVRADATSARVAIIAEAEGALRVRGDPDQLRQAVLNLAVNAIEAIAPMPMGRRSVTLTARAAGAVCVLSVSDSGPGLPQALLDAAFGPFDSEKPQGIGLGLMIARTIVEGHGGRITAANRSGGGAVFEIALPLENADV